MRTAFNSSVVIAAAVLFACGGTNGGTGGGGGSGGGSTGGGSAAGGGSSAGGGSATGGGSAAGGGSATGGGSGSGGGTTDAGTPIAITFSANCPAFTPCGGNVVGSWGYTSVCVDSADPFPQIAQSCPGSSFSNLAGTTRGGVSFDAISVQRDVHYQLTGTLTVAGQCALAGCAATQNLLKPTFTSITCTGTSTCSCDFVYDSVTADAAPYTAVGTRITTSPGTNDERDYDYCVSGNTLTYQEVTSSPAEPGVATLLPR